LRLALGGDSASRKQSRTRIALARRPPAQAAAKGALAQARATDAREIWERAPRAVHY